MNNCIYLDYMATTPVDPRVVAVMNECLGLEGCFGNPASHSHQYGHEAAQRVHKAREQVAALVNASPNEVIWTSGATESDNLAIKGACEFYHRRGKHIVTCLTEHKAVLDTCGYLETQGYEVTYLKTLPSGLIDLSELAASVRDDTVIVSIMAVNNETGVIQDLAAIADIVKAKGALLHSDAAQALGKIDIDLKRLPVDLMSFSGHKAYGPKGIGALYVRRDPKIHLAAQMHGGGHEQGMRSGTLATHQIAGMGKACDILLNDMADDRAHCRALKQLCLDRLTQDSHCMINGDVVHAIPGCLNFAFKGIPSLQLLLNLPGLALSSGSACNSATPKPSHVLTAMGIPAEEADCAVRMSFGRFTTESQIASALSQILTAREKLSNHCHKS